MHSRTIASEISVSGIGLHSGKINQVQISFGRVFNPLLSGIFFANNKPSLYNYNNNYAPLSPSDITDTAFSTCIKFDKNNNKSKINTIEHLMAALWAFKITALEIKVTNDSDDSDDVEIPILDGSSKIWCDHFSRAKLQYYNTEVTPIIIHDRISVEYKDSFLEIIPYDGFFVDITIDFPYKSIGQQRYISDVTPSIFKDELSFCRTFVHVDDATKLKMRGKALGGSFDNAIVVNETKVLNEEGLRVKDEFVKHKVLDLIGDLWTLGRPIQGKIVGYKPGHTINNMLARQLEKEYSLYTG